MKRSYFSLLLLPLLFTACGNNPPAPGGVVISSVTLVSSPIKENYTVGEYFEPSGLSVKVTKSDESFYMISYLSNEGDFSFSPSLTTPLTAEIVNVVGTYENKEFLIPVTVSEEETKTVTMDFTVKHSQDGSLPTQGNTGNNKFAEIIDHYYLASEDISLTGLSGSYMQINNGWSVTPTRTVEQIMVLGSKTYSCNVEFKFSKTIKSVTFVSESYSKYVSYNSEFHVDYDTSLTIGTESKDYPAHSLEDVEEIVSNKFTINSDSFTIETPEPDPEDELSKAKRIMVYQMILEF